MHLESQIVCKASVNPWKILRLNQIELIYLNNQFLYTFFFTLQSDSVHDNFFMLYRVKRDKLYSCDSSLMDFPEDLILFNKRITCFCVNFLFLIIKIMYIILIFWVALIHLSPISDIFKLCAIHHYYFYIFRLIYWI